MTPASAPKSVAERWILLALATFTASAGASWLVTLRPELFHFELLGSGAGWALCTVAVLAGLWMWRKPETGPALLAVLVYTNLSQILVRYHALPSLLQLLALPLAVLVLLQARDRTLLANRRGSLLFLLLALYNAVLLLSSTVALDSSLTDERWVENTKALLIFTFVALLATTPAAVLVLVRAVVASAALISSLTIVQVLTGDFSQEMWGLARVKNAQIYGTVFESRVAGPLGDPNFFAQVLLLAVPLALVLAWREEQKGLRIAAALSAGVIVAATLLTYSRGGTVALALVLLGCAFIHPRPGRALAALVLAGALVVPILPGGVTHRLLTIAEVLPGEETLHPDSAIEERRLYTQVAQELFWQHPWLGVGAGNYPVHFQEGADRVGSDARAYGDPEERYYPHSLYLEIAAETGLVGLLSFGAVLTAFYSSLRRSRRRFRAAGSALFADLCAGALVGLTGYLVAALFLHGHHQRYLWLLFGLIAAISRLAPSAAVESE